MSRTEPLPAATTYVVIGAGVHGMSTALHLARELKARGRSPDEVLLLDKTGPGAGATGIACGCVRNFYMTEAIHPILRHSVDVWMEDPIGFGFQQVGYVSAGEANQTADYERMHRSQNAAGYPSDLYVGKEAKRFLTDTWPDFKTDGIDVVLHERPSGYAGTRQFVRGMVEKLQAAGVRLASGVAVTGYDVVNGTVRAVLTDAGPVRCEAAVLAPGAWIGQHWDWLGQPARLACRYPDGGTAETDMWTYWRLLEGEVSLDRPYRSATDRDPPVLHVELMNTPVIGPDGKPFDDHLYVYWKNAAERMDGQGVQGGTIPVQIGPQAALEPYGHANDAYQADPWFADYFCAALGQLMGRFEASRPRFRERRNGGIGAFTPDNVPIFDWLLPNLYMIADSNHGFKMTGVGKLVARLLVGGNRVPELAPFALSRYAEGRTFGDRNSHCPWV